MKLLFDENLSPRLVAGLADIYPNSAHVREKGLRSADDSDVWEFAKSSGFVIVSKDSDFHQRSFLRGHPPKVIWLRIGNCSARFIERVLRTYHNEISSFDEDEKASFLVIS
jgi:predicted nuclease of predicted toxin-antitoxin system